MVYGIQLSIFRTLEIILSWFEIRLPRYGQKNLLNGFKIGFAVFTVVFLNIEVVLRRLEVRFQIYGRIHLFAGFDIGFTAFAVLFLEHWMLFCIYWRYGSKDMAENIYSPAFKLRLLQFSVVFLEHWRLFCVNRRYGCQDTGKMFIRLLWKWVYSIRRSIFRTFEVILCRLDVQLQRY